MDVATSDTAKKTGRVKAASCRITNRIESGLRMAGQKSVQNAPPSSNADPTFNSTTVPFATAGTEPPR